jgi:plasmid stability protein
MTITLSLPPDLERQLHDRAARAGRDAAAFARELLERALADGPTFDELLAPLRAQVAATETTDAELDALFEQARDQVWRDRPR